MADHARLVWDQTGEKLYETGVRQGVLYPQAEDGSYPKGVAWNGLTSVNESPSGGEATTLYADDVKYLDLMSAEEFGMTIEAYMYPDEFRECDGSKELAPGIYIGQQNRKTFGFCYRTTLGNDVKGNEYGYKLHIIYGCKANPSDTSYSSINDSPDANTFSWESKATPVPVTIGDVEHKPTASITIDSSRFTTEQAKKNLAALEDVLYGSETADARLPLPAEIYSILTAAS